MTKQKTPHSAGFSGPHILRSGQSPPTLTSTRRFFAMFSGVSLGAIGLSDPCQKSTILESSMP